MRTNTRGPSFGHSALTASMRRQSSRGRLLKICRGAAASAWQGHNPLARANACARRETGGATAVNQACRGRRAYRDELVKRLIVHLRRGSARLLGGGSCWPEPCAAHAHAARWHSTTGALRKHTSARRQPVRRAHSRCSRHGARRATDTRRTGASGVQARCTTRRGLGVCRGSRATHVARRNGPQAHVWPR